MNEFLLYSVAITALVVSDVLLVVLGALVYRRYRRNPNRDTAQDDAFHSELRQELKALAVSMTLLGERLARLEAQMGRLEECREQQNLPGSKEADHKAFEVATKMALQGAGVEELIDLCGLTRGEAELIRMLHAEQVVARPRVVGQ